MKLYEYLSTQKNLGYVLVGGGHRGAYQVGGWKVLCDYKIDQNIKVVSGCSIGALNGLMFRGLSPDQALQTWRSGVLSKAFYRSLKFLGNDNPTKTRLFKLFMRIAQGHTHNYKLYCTITSGDDTEYKDYDSVSSPEDKVKIVLASAALKNIFSGINIGGKTYEDGAFGVKGDVAPAYPIVHNHSDINIILVHWLRSIPLRNFKKIYQNKEWVYISPSKNIELPASTINPSKTAIESMINLGMIDMKNLLDSEYQPKESK